LAGLRKPVRRLDRPASRGRARRQIARHVRPSSQCSSRRHRDGHLADPSSPPRRVSRTGRGAPGDNRDGVVGRIADEQAGVERGPHRIRVYRLVQHMRLARRLGGRSRPHPPTNQTIIMLTSRQRTPQHGAGSVGRDSMERRTFPQATALSSSGHHRPDRRHADLKTAKRSDPHRGFESHALRSAGVALRVTSAHAGAVRRATSPQAWSSAARRSTAVPSSSPAA
jgi:hypothetical protein